MATYGDDGVNVELGDDFSAFSAEVCRSTWKGLRFVEVKDYAPKNFRGPRGFNFKHLPRGARFDLPSDGVGTKVGIITEALSHRTAGYDLIAMGASDITRYGGLPLVATNVLDVSTLGAPGSDTYNAMGELVRGLGDACREAGIALFRGETAELGPYVGSENPDAFTKFNWSGSILGVYHPKRMITGERIHPGDVVIALRERGFRSNGISSVRAAFAKKFGTEWWTSTDREYHLALDEAVVPSVLYDRFLSKMNGWYSRRFEPIVDIMAMSHISGGGIPSKFGKDILFPLGLSARLDTLWHPPSIMWKCGLWRGFTAHEFYKTWNGGQGMLVVVAKEDVAQFIGMAEAEGILAKRAGKIFRPSKGEVPRLEICTSYPDHIYQMISFLAGD